MYYLLINNRTGPSLEDFSVDNPDVMKFPLEESQLYHSDYGVQKNTDIFLSPDEHKQHLVCDKNCIK